MAIQDRSLRKLSSLASLLLTSKCKIIPPMPSINSVTLLPLVMFLCTSTKLFSQALRNSRKRKFIYAHHIHAHISNLADWLEVKINFGMQSIDFWHFPNPFFFSNFSHSLQLKKKQVLFPRAIRFQ